MLTLAPILLTILLSAGDQPTDLVNVAVEDLSRAPQIRQLPDGLPGARLAPVHGRWVEIDRAIDEAVRTTDRALGVFGTYLPAPLDREYYRRLRACEKLPVAFQIQLDGLLQKLKVDSEGRVKATEARCIAQRLQDESIVVNGWRDWQVVLLTVAAAVVAGSGVAVIMKIGN